MHEQLKEYYGRVLKESKDLKTNACCCDPSSVPDEIKDIIGEIEPEITRRFYGCGSPIPPLLEGCTVLDLGCGTGRDAYIVSRLVGEQGNVIGVDMTDEQLATARKYVEPQMKKFGYRRANVSFEQGYIEDLKTIGIADNSVDVVISNCVVNLSPDKHSVFREIFRVLKPGGELYFSDVFADRRIPDELKNDAVLYGECLSGALYFEDFRRLLNQVGCRDFRVVSSAKIAIGDVEVDRKIGMISFFSKTVRAFKLDNLEDICEDYGQAAVYRGTISGHPHFFDLDDHHRFYTKKPMLVCGNTAAMIQQTRFCEHFEVTGDRSVHFGPFDCTPETSSSDAGETSGSCC